MKEMRFFSVFFSDLEESKPASEKSSIDVSFFCFVYSLGLLEYTCENKKTIEKKTSGKERGERAAPRTDTGETKPATT